ncbi:MAG: hypothetical protein ACTSSP_11490 [Candidatus Asgardarchaeia archaeon]
MSISAGQPVKQIIQRNVTLTGGIVEVMLRLKDMEIDAEDEGFYGIAIEDGGIDTVVFDLVGYKIEKEKS